MISLIASYLRFGPIGADSINPACAGSGLLVTFPTLPSSQIGSLVMLICGEAERFSKVFDHFHILHLICINPELYTCQAFCKIFGYISLV